MRQSALGLCPRDFSQCPRGWTGNGGSCLPPIDYTGAPTAAGNIKLWVLSMWCQVYVGSLICRAQVNQTLKLDRHQDISGCTWGFVLGIGFRVEAMLHAQTRWFFFTLAASTTFCRCGVEFACKMCVRDLAADLCPEVSKSFFVMFFLENNLRLAARQGWSKKNGEGLIMCQPSANFTFLFGVIRDLCSAGHLYRTM